MHFFFATRIFVYFMFESAGSAAGMRRLELEFKPPSSFVCHPVFLVSTLMYWDCLAGDRYRFIDANCPILDPAKRLISLYNSFRCTYVPTGCLVGDR